MPRKSSNKQPKQVETLKHDDATRKNIPTAEYQSVMAEDEQSPIRVAYERRNRDLDPQLVWRGKDEQDWSDLVVSAPPLYIQEKVHPKIIIDDLVKSGQWIVRGVNSRKDSLSTDRSPLSTQLELDLFADFNGLPEGADRTDFYQHDARWTNRMILGDSLQVMASLAEREGLRGKVQCIYIDPPYGINFNSNFQWSTTSRTVTDGKKEHITREPEQVKAFRDTWRDGIHSYLTYLRDRLIVARDLLTDSGSIFVQIGDTNIHRVRDLMDEVFGSDNFCNIIDFQKSSGQASELLPSVSDYLVWYAKDKSCVKYRKLYEIKDPTTRGGSIYNNVEDDLGNRRRLRKEELAAPSLIKGKVYAYAPLTSTGFRNTLTVDFYFNGKRYHPGGNYYWKVHPDALKVVGKTNRIYSTGKNIYYIRYLDDFPVIELTDSWRDTSPGFQSQVYVVQTITKVIERCLCMTTDPGDLVIDPTCGSGSTAYVAEQWGRRWISIDTSRVALALARARIMGARYSYYLLKDSTAGREKEAELTRKPASTAPTYNNIRQGFVYARAPHIMLSTIANNTEIDVIWEQSQLPVEQALADLNAALQGHNQPYKVTTGGRDGKTIDFTASGTVKLPSGENAPANALLEWEVPREIPSHWPLSTHPPHTAFWQARIARQKEIDASIAASADQEFLYDKPYEDKSIVRVAGPFTVESLSPHRVLAVDENDELVDRGDSDVVNSGQGIVDSEQSQLTTQNYPLSTGTANDFASVILETLKVAGVQQAHKDDKITFSSLTGWPGAYICAEGRYVEGESETEKRAGIFIGPEFGTVSRADLVAASREAGDAGFDVLIACAFNYDAHSAEFTKLGRIPVLKARMNADLHMADTLKNTGAGNLFVIFGEPDIHIIERDDGQIQVQISGIDVFHPSSGEVRSSSADEIACWFIDTDYNEESFFVRHAYFLGASDPYKSLKTTLKAEIDAEAWKSLYSDTSRPFAKPQSGRIAVKAINHLGDEVMKVFSIG